LVAGGSSGDDDSQWRAVGVDPDDERVAVGGSNGVGNDMEWKGTGRFQTLKTHEYPLKIDGWKIQFSFNGIGPFLGEILIFMGEGVK